MILAVASGKGGTGKTTLSLGLARVLPGPVQLVDCDVEEPDDHLFLPTRLRRREEVTLPAPRIDPDRCTGCGACSDFCRFHALAPIRPVPLVFPELCHACGGCVRVCPEQAITEVPRRIGSVELRTAGRIHLLQGRLDVGVATATPLIRAVTARIDPRGHVILDAPPGTGCPVVATVRRADVVVLVTEPTPFGLYDLTLAVEMMEEVDRPHGVVVNRTTGGSDPVARWCRERGIPVLLEIPDDRRVAEAYARGENPVDAVPELRSRLSALPEALLDLAASARAAS
jgi:MinD superfamily P-loop ATPase